MPAVVDEHDRQALAVQVGQVLQGSLRLDRDQAVERFRRHLRREPENRLLAATGAEQQQAVPLGLHDVDDALEHLTHPRPGERRDEHPDDPGTAARQADRPGARHVAELVDHLTNPSRGCRVEIVLAVENAGHRGLTDPGATRHIGHGDRHGSLPSTWVTLVRPIVRPAVPVAQSPPEPLPGPLPEPVPEPVAGMSKRSHEGRRQWRRGNNVTHLRAVQREYHANSPRGSGDARQTRDRVGGGGQRVRSRRAARRRANRAGSGSSPPSASTAVP